MHYYPHHISDYQRDTAHLTLLEHGVYRQLLDHYYATEKPLPCDPASLFRITRAQRKSERQSVLRIVEEFFERSDEGYEHSRVMNEIKRFSGRTAASRMNGLLGGRGRKAKAKTPAEPAPVAPVPAPVPAPPTVSWNPTQQQIIVSRWFRRPATEPWTDKELAAWTALGRIAPSDLALMNSRYTSKEPDTVKFRRKSLITLFANWRVELDFARTAPQPPPDDGRIF